MSSEVLINVTPQESRVAILKNGVLQEIHIERTSRRGHVGNIFWGKVSRILPGMEAAFIDIGLEKSAFLHVSDLTNQFHGAYDDQKKNIPVSISKMLHEGKQILVQVIKDPIGTKGARLTTFTTIPARYLVLVANDSAIGISSKIEDPNERQRLKTIVQELKQEIPSQYGYIIRTAAEGVTKQPLEQEIKFLQRQWKKISEKKHVKKGRKPQVIYSDLPLTHRLLRDLSGHDIESIRIDSRETFHSIKQFCLEYIPELLSVLKHYSGSRPLFDMHNVEEEITKALRRKVQLKSGGYLIIDQTEAMTTIDINTGGFIGVSNLEETIFKTNLEAAQSIARQLRLRNLGGIIIIDFIDMCREEHRKMVIHSLEKELIKDPTKTYVTGVSQLGLVEMTRKRTRESLEHVLCEECPTCTGRGYIKTAQTVCYEIFREIIREIRLFDAQEFLVLASQEVVDILLDEESDNLAQLQSFVDRKVRFQAERLYTQEQYDIVLL